MHDDGLSYSNMKLKPKSKQLKQRHANVDSCCNWFLHNREDLQDHSQVVKTTMHVSV